MANTNSIFKIEELDILLRMVHKIESKVLAGQFIIAYRDIGSLRAYLERSKSDAVENAKREMDEAKHDK